MLDVPGRLVGAGEPGSDHDVGGAGRQGQGHVARVADPAVGPHVRAQPCRLAGALQDGGELRAAHPGLHAGGAHGARPHPDLDDGGSGPHQVAHPGGGHDVAGGDGDGCGQGGAHGGDRLEHAVLVAVGGVDDDDVHARGDELGGPAGGLPVHADGGAHPQAPVGVDGGGVDGGAHGPGAGEQAHEPPVGVDDGGEPAAGGAQGLEGLAGVDALGQGEQLGAHDRADLGEAVDVGHVPQVHHAHGGVRLRVDDDGGAVGALGDQPQGVAAGVVRLDGDGGVVDGVGGLDLGDGVDDDVDGDVLRDDRDPAAAGDGLGHALAGDGRHIGHDEGDGGARGVIGGQVHAHATAHRRARGDHEDVVVGQVEGGRQAVEELHSPRIAGSTATATAGSPRDRLELPPVRPRARPAPRMDNAPRPTGAAGGGALVRQKGFEPPTF